MAKSKFARASFNLQKRRDLLKSIEGVAFKISCIKNLNEQTSEQLDSYFKESNEFYKWLGRVYFYNPTTDEIFSFDNNIDKGFDYKINPSDNWYLRKLNNLPPPKLRHIGPFDELVSDFTDARKWLSYYFNPEANTMICADNFLGRKLFMPLDEDCYLRKLNNLPSADTEEECGLRKQKIEVMNASLMKSIEGVATELKSNYAAGSRYFYDPTTNIIFALHRYSKGFEYNVTPAENGVLRKLNGLRPAT